MSITLTWQTVITVSAVVGAAVAISAYVARAVRWVDRQKRQDIDITELKQEQRVIVYGLLACLKGLKEQGCNGPVTDAINSIEKHINKRAHE